MIDNMSYRTILEWVAGSQTLKEEALKEAVIQYCLDRQLKYRVEHYPGPLGDMAILVVHATTEQHDKLTHYLKALQNRDLPE